MNWEIIFFIQEEISNLTLFAISTKKMKLNIYFISTKNRLNIKTAFLRSTSPFGKDTIREYRNQVYSLSICPTSFTNIKFTHKPFPSAQIEAKCQSRHSYILRYITYNCPKFGISTHWPKYWPLTNWQHAWEGPYGKIRKHWVLPAIFA